MSLSHPVEGSADSRQASLTAAGVFVLGADIGAMGVSYAGGLALFEVLGSWSDIYVKQILGGFGVIWAEFTASASVLIILFALRGHYVPGQRFRTESFQILVAICCILGVAGVALLGTDTTFAFKPLACTMAIVAIAVPAQRYILKSLLHRWGLWRLPTVVVGTPDSASIISERLARDPYAGFEVTDYIGPDHLKELQDTARTDLVGGFSNRHWAPGTLFVFPMDRFNLPLADQALDRLGSQEFSIAFASPGLYREMNGVAIQDAVNQIAQALPGSRSNKPILHFAKRLFDIAGALGLMIALTPVFVLISLAVMRRDGLPILYGSPRVGRDGRIFKCWKFRSMINNADKMLDQLLENDPKARLQWEDGFKLDPDPRVTPIGNFLRRTSLDELPQLFNVLTGEMSLVGPRPMGTCELSAYTGKAFELYKSVRPGMTGLWQVSGRNDICYADRIKMNSHYIARWTFVGDIWILLRTVVVVWTRVGAK